MAKRIKMNKNKTGKANIASTSCCEPFNKKAAMFIENKKTLIIAVVSITAILALVILIFFGKGFVGKAYTTLPESTFTIGSAGAEETITVPIEAGETFTLMVGANLGTAESVALEFELNYDPSKLDMVSPEVDIVSGLLDHWGNDFIRITDFGSSVKLEHATLDYTKAITGPVHLAELSFRALQTLTEDDIASALTFSDIAVFNSDDSSNIITPPYIQPSGITECPSFTDADGENWFNNLPLLEKEALCAGFVDCPDCPICSECTDVIGNDEPREVLIKKVIALTNGECYTDNTDVMYCGENQQGITKPDADGKITAQQKVALVVNMGAALVDFFNEVISS